MQHGRIMSLQDCTITGSPAQVLPFTIYSLEQDANGALAPGSKRRIGTWIETTGLSMDHQPVYPGWVPATEATQVKIGTTIAPKDPVPTVTLGLLLLAVVEPPMVRRAVELAVEAVNRNPKILPNHTLAVEGMSPLSPPKSPSHW